MIHDLMVLRWNWETVKFLLRVISDGVNILQAANAIKIGLTAHLVLNKKGMNK